MEQHRILAESYSPESNYHSYKTQLINSTRVVADDGGNKVYAEAYDPYDRMQQFWTTAFDPERKFTDAGDDPNFRVDLSGKQQDTESGLYYFGARYYDPTLYRFLTPDPMFYASLMKSDMQQWNLYSYCKNNPLSFIDFEGLYTYSVHTNIIRLSWGDRVPDSREDHIIWMIGAGLMLFPSGNITPVEDERGNVELNFDFNCNIYILPDDQLEFWGYEYDSVLKHELEHRDQVMKWVEKRLKKIEAEYLKEAKVDPEKALENAKNATAKALKKAQLWSKAIMDLDVQALIEYMFAYWDDVDRYWIRWRDDPYMAWLLSVPYAS